MKNWRLVFLIWISGLCLVYGFHINKLISENEERKNTILEASLIVKRSVNTSTGAGVTSVDGNHGNQSTEGTNDTNDHNDGSHGDGHSSHHQIHLASLNFDHVKSPLIIAVFLLAAGIAKLGTIFMLLPFLFGFVFCTVCLHITNLCHIKEKAFTLTPLLA